MGVANTRRPGVIVDVVANTRIINITDQVRVPAVVGLGPTQLSITDEAVIRGKPGTADELANEGNVTVSQIMNIPGLTSGSYGYADNLYSESDYTVSENTITWESGAATTNGGTLTQGDIYYVTYTAPVPSTYLDPKIYVDGQDILDERGPEDLTDGILSIGGRLELENGAPAVWLVQASGSTFSSSEYKTAIDKLKKKKNVAYITAVFPSGSVTQSEIETIHSYLVSHASQMSQPAVGKERAIILGDGNSDTVSTGGIDNVGDATTASTLVYQADRFDDANVVYMVPNKATRPDASGNTMTLDGNFVGCAMAGLVTGQNKPVTPVTGQSLTGITIENELYNDFENEALLAAGACLIESRGGITKVVHAQTTDITNADTNEISVKDSERRVKRAVREGLDAIYMGKGIVVTPETPSDVAGSTQVMLDQLARDGEIYDYGTTSDPVTGEVPISAKQNSSEPRRIDVTFSFKHLYPLNWIRVTVNTYV